MFHYPEKELGGGNVACNNANVAYDGGNVEHDGGIVERDGGNVACNGGNVVYKTRVHSHLDCSIISKQYHEVTSLRLFRYSERHEVVYITQ